MVQDTPSYVNELAASVKSFIDWSLCASCDPPKPICKELVSQRVAG